MQELVEYYKKNRQMLVKQAARRVSPLWAEDVVHNAFERAWKFHHQEIRDFNAWFRGIFNRACYDMHKEVRGQYTEVSEEDWVTTPSMDSKLYYKEIMSKIDSYPPQHRQVLHCAYSLDCKDAQIAQITGLSLDNIQVIKYRFCAKMRARYGESYT